MRCANAAKNSSASVAWVDIAFSATTRSQIDRPGRQPDQQRRGDARSPRSRPRCRRPAHQRSPPEQRLEQSFDGPVDRARAPLGAALGHLDRVILQPCAPAVEIDELVVDDQRADQADRGQAARRSLRRGHDDHAAAQRSGADPRSARTAAGWPARPAGRPGPAGPRPRPAAAVPAAATGRLPAQAARAPPRRRRRWLPRTASAPASESRSAAPRRQTPSRTARPPGGRRMLSAGRFSAAPTAYLTSALPPAARAVPPRPRRGHVYPAISASNISGPVQRATRRRLSRAAG